MPYVYLILAFTINAAANIILKIAATRTAGQYLFLLGVLLFGINVVFYYLALKHIPLSTAYPIMLVASLLLATGYARFFLGENISPMQALGYLLIIVGIGLVFWFTRP